MANKDWEGGKGSSVFTKRQGTGMETQRFLLTDTLKRHPKLDLAKPDLLELLSYLEGELQARDVTIAALKLDKLKSMLAHAKYGRSDTGDPVCALQRDSDLVNDTSFDDSSVHAMFGDQLRQLENLITTQHACQRQMRDQLVAVEKQYHKTCAELEDTKNLYAKEMEAIDNVMYLLEKDRERCKQELEAEKAKNKKLENELRHACTGESEDHHTVTKHQQVALMLIRERSRLVAKLLESRQHCNDVEQQLKEERERTQSLDENLERQIAECDQLCTRLSSAESLNRALQTELNRLRSAAQSLEMPAHSPLSRSPQTPHSTRITMSAPLKPDMWKGHNGQRTSPDVHPAGLNGTTPSLEDVNRRLSPSPMDREAAAARIRSVLSTAVDNASFVGSEGGSARSLIGLPFSVSERQSMSPVPNRVMPLPGSRLPVLSSGISAPSSDQFLHSRGVTHPLASSLPVGNNSLRTVRPLTPLLTTSLGFTGSSPNLASLSPVLGQTNGNASNGGGYVQKMPSIMHSRMK